MTEKSYAHRDVLDKLGIEAGTRVRAIGPVPDELIDRARSRDGVQVVGADDLDPVDIVLFRLTESDDPEPAFESLERMIMADGGIWVLTAKRGQPGYLPQTDLIPVGKAGGLVDNKVCSVDDETSAMRFVIPRERRDEHVPEGGGTLP